MFAKHKKSGSYGALFTQIIMKTNPRLAFTAKQCALHHFVHLQGNIVY